MPQTTPDQIILIVLGVVVILAGLILLRLRLPDAPPGEEPRRPHPLPLSEPTRLTISVVMLVVGYHLIMWAVPPQWGSPVVVSPHRWYYLAAGSLLVIAASLLLDWTGARAPRD